MAAKSGNTAKPTAAAKDRTEGDEPATSEVVSAETPASETAEPKPADTNASADTTATSPAGVAASETPAAATVAADPAAPNVLVPIVDAAPAPATDPEPEHDEKVGVYVMAIAIGGTRNGAPWPPVGGQIELPESEAASYVQFGYIRTVE